tara:strand:- start:19469 stop:19783 length:315 start_codon:yes stop_codon:yes gene_type:complete
MTKGARSYKGEVIGDSMAITINFKWLLQIIAGTAVVVYFFWRMESRIVELERQMLIAMEEIQLHEEERKAAEAAHIEEMEERMSWYEQELNLNPFSWGKKKKGK